MPEATVNKDNFFPAWKYKVRRSWQITTMEPVSISHGENQSPHDQLGLRILASNTRHQRTSLFRRHKCRLFGTVCRKSKQEICGSLLYFLSQQQKRKIIEVSIAELPWTRLEMLSLSRTSPYRCDTQSSPPHRAEDTQASADKTPPTPPSAPTAA